MKNYCEKRTKRIDTFSLTGSNFINIYKLNSTVCYCEKDIF